MPSIVTAASDPGGAVVRGRGKRHMPRPASSIILFSSSPRRPASEVQSCRLQHASAQRREKRTDSIPPSPPVCCISPTRRPLSIFFFFFFRGHCPVHHVAVVLSQWRSPSLLRRRASVVLARGLRVPSPCFHAPPPPPPSPRCVDSKARREAGFGGRIGGTARVGVVDAKDEGSRRCIIRAVGAC